MIPAAILVIHESPATRRPAACASMASGTASVVLFAIGQEKLSELVSGLDGVVVERGRIVVDEGGATGRPGVYSGGDCVNGGKEVVNAAAEGKLAATSMHRFMMGGSDA